MKLFAEFKTNNNPQFDTVELTYSCLFGAKGNWFCRIWHKNWLFRASHGIKEMGEAYGRNKFEAYRLALKDLI